MTHSQQRTVIISIHGMSSFLGASIVPFSTGMQECEIFLGGENESANAPGKMTCSRKETGNESLVEIARLYYRMKIISLFNLSLT